MFAVLAAAAEYELELRAERQAEGRMLPGKKHIGRPTGTALSAQCMRSFLSVTDSQQWLLVLLT